MATFRTTSATTTSATIKTTGGSIYSVNIVNKHSAVIYVRFYNSSVSTFQDTPIITIAVPATSSVRQIADRQEFPLISGTAGLSVRAVTDVADNGNTAPGTLPEIVVDYI